MLPDVILRPMVTFGDSKRPTRSADAIGKKSEFFISWTMAKLLCFLPREAENWAARLWIMNGCLAAFLAEIGGTPDSGLTAVSVVRASEHVADMFSFAAPKG